MSSKHAIKHLLLISALFLLFGCKKNNSQEKDENIDEVIPAEVIQVIDDCPITYYRDIRAFGFHYKGEAPLDKLFSAMCTQALFLTDTLQYGEQKGLAYVLGYGIPQSKEKDYRIPRIGSSVNGKECNCQEPLYGLDCSGFIAHVMNAVGIKGLSQMTANQQVNYFKNLTELNTSLYQGKITIEEIENVGVADIKNGDIIYRTDGNIAKHIGILFKTTGGRIIMFQSSGSPSYSCEENRHESGRGPIQKELNAENLDKYFKAGSGKAQIIRITPDYSGFYFSGTPFDSTKWNVPENYQSTTTGTRRIGEWHSSSNGGYYTYHTEPFTDSNNGSGTLLPTFRNNTLVVHDLEDYQLLFDFIGDSIYITVKVEGEGGTIGLQNGITYSSNEGNNHEEFSIKRWFSNDNTFCLKIIDNGIYIEGYGYDWQHKYSSKYEALYTFSIDNNSHQCTIEIKETSNYDVILFGDEFTGILHENTNTTYHGVGTWEYGDRNELSLYGKHDNNILFHVLHSIQAIKNNKSRCARWRITGQRKQ